MKQYWRKIMKDVQEHFDSEAEDYDSLILTLIPNYSEMTDVLVNSIPFNEKKTFEVLDLGCGTGNISKKIKDKFPNSKIHCVDLAENMVKIAQKKLSNYLDITYEIGDFQNISLNSDYEVIVSSLAMHHLKTDQDKKDVYQKVYESLTSGGVFYNADVVLGSTDYLQNLYIEKWKEFMALNHSHKEIENKWMPTHRREDKPAKMIDHIQWLQEAGFKQVDVVWKYYNYGVYGGVK
jgi:tRNA (cmo5U34)-methyltransferase